MRTFAFSIKGISLRAIFDIKNINWILLFFLSTFDNEICLPCVSIFFSNVLLQNLLQRKEGMLKYVHRAEKPYPWLLICFWSALFQLEIHSITLLWMTFSSIQFNKTLTVLNDTSTFTFHLYDNCFLSF